MAAKRNTNRLITGTAATAGVDMAVAKLDELAAKSTSAVNTVGKERTTLLTQSRRLSKKRATLMRKKKSATRRLRSDPSAANKKAVLAIEKEITSNKKEAARNNDRKSKVTNELKMLKAIAKRVTAYNRALEKVDKTLAKPKKRRARRKMTA
jgi:hypothetical protein